MIYDVKGTAIVKHFCDCSFCHITQENTEVDVRAIAVDKSQAMRKALSETINWLKWREEPTVSKVTVPFERHPDTVLRTFEGFVTDGFIAVKLELAGIGDEKTEEAKDAKKLLEYKRKVHLTHNGEKERDLIIYRSEDGSKVYTSELYHEAFEGLGVAVYSTTDPVQPDAPCLLIDRGEVVGFFMPLHRGR